MLLALTAIVFILGYSVATLSRKNASNTQADLSRFIINVKSLLYSLWTGSTTTSEKLDKALEAVQKDECSEDGTKHLLSRAQVEDVYGEGTWERSAYEDFKETITNSAPNAKIFPCVYATAGFKANDHRYVFLPTDDPSSPSNIRILGPAMRAYLSLAPTIGSNTSLVLICAPSPVIASLEEYTSRFWSFLRGLRTIDDAAWPEEFPSATGHEQWTMCYAGEALFPIALTPAHRHRRSRYAKNLIVAMQPKWVIDRLLATSEKRRAATEKVRSLLREYDEVDISPDLTAYGEQGSSESRQLCLRDDNVSSETPYADLDQ